MLRRSARLVAFVLALLLLAPRASAEERPPREHGVPLMATGAVLFGSSYLVSLAIGMHASIDYLARCGDSGPRPLAEAIDCLDAPAAMYLMVPIAGPFEALADARDDADRALLVADGIAQVSGVVLAGIGMAQYIDGRASRSAASRASVKLAPQGAGLQLTGTF